MRIIKCPCCGGIAMPIFSDMALMAYAKSSEKGNPPKCVSCKEPYAVEVEGGESIDISPDGSVISFKSDFTFTIKKYTENLIVNEQEMIDSIVNHCLTGK